MTPADVLRAARKKIERPEAWVKGTAARTANGKPCMPKAGCAACWCPIGAISSLDGEADVATLANALHFLEKAVRLPIPSWNDKRERTHGEVLAAFDRAIALAEAA